MADNKSLLCVGIDPDLEILGINGDDPLANMDKLRDFCINIVDQTADYAGAFKPNNAFFEATGVHGCGVLEEICSYIKNKYPDIPIIMDAKRADIGNTNRGYAKFIFDYLGADAVTLHPYLGGEALQPFLDRQDKTSFILARTSNPGAGEFQDLIVDGKPLYQIVAENFVNKWNANGNIGLVTGATYPEEIKNIRASVGDEVVFLIPGIGAQGGDLEATLRAGLNSKNEGVLINSSRGIIFADDPKSAARDLFNQIETIRSQNG